MESTLPPIHGPRTEAPPPLLPPAPAPPRRKHRTWPWLLVILIGVPLIGGMVIATFLGVFFTPSLYAAVQGFSDGLGKLFGKPASAATSAIAVAGGAAMDAEPAVGSDSGSDSSSDGESTEPKE